MSSTKLEDNAADIVADLAKIRDDIAKLSGAMGELLLKQASTAGDQVRDAVDGARASFASSSNDAQATMYKASADLEGKIERNPMTAVLVALAAGLVLGMSTHARR